MGLVSRAMKANVAKLLNVRFWVKADIGCGRFNVR